MKKTGIYKIESTLTNRFYIGSAINIQTRWTRHLRDLKNDCHHSIFLQRHCNKYGKKDLKFSILEECNKEDLMKIEQYYLDSLECHFNMAKIAGSTRGMKKSQEFKDKISKLTKGKNNPTYGLERTKEWRAKISKANKGHKSWSKGKTNIYSPEMIKQMSESAKNRLKIICEHCNLKLDISNYNRWHGDNCKAKNIIILDNEKYCPKCNIVKNKSNFTKNKRSKDGFSNICKTCRSKYMKLRYEKDNQ